MLAKKFRLPIQDFVGKRGKLIRTPLFLLKIFSPGKEFSRFGATISAKVAKKATERNQLRRLLYDSIKEYYNDIPRADYWITVLLPATKLTKGVIKAELGKILNSKF